MDITELLKFAVTEDASDIHLSSGEPPMLRINGDVKRLEHDPLTPKEIHEMIFDVMNDQQRQLFQEHRDLDFSYEIGDTARFRVNAFNQRKGEGAVFRIIPTDIHTVEQLGLPTVLEDVSSKHRGLVLVTGPTGSGKSTSLSAMIDYVNANREAHILTIEDPIEFVHESKKCLINQREVGSHTKSFSSALRAALREDPDVILVGEMRDLETISLALTAAETGHLVFGTLHTSSAPKTVDRVIDVFPAAQQGQVRAMFAESIQMIMTQTLCRKKEGGRVPACEILIGTPAVRNLIREGKIHQIPSAMQTGQKLGMQTLDMALQGLLADDKITREEARARASNPDLFRPAPGTSPGNGPAQFQSRPLNGRTM